MQGLKDWELCMKPCQAAIDELGIRKDINKLIIEYAFKIPAMKGKNKMDLASILRWVADILEDKKNQKLLMSFLEKAIKISKKRMGAWEKFPECYQKHCTKEARDMSLDALRIIYSVATILQSARVTKVLQEYVEIIALSSQRMITAIQSNKEGYGP